MTVPLYIVQLEPGVWIAPWRSDPGRTLIERSARRFKGYARAERALADARQYSPFADAKIVKVES